MFGKHSMEEAVREEPEISNDVAPPISNIADVELSWNDVHLAIKQGKKPPLTILKGVDGIVRPTELVAILGSSGIFCYLLDRCWKDFTTEYIGW